MVYNGFIKKGERYVVILFSIVVLTALIEIGIMLVASGDKYSKIHGILENEKQTAGLILILIGVNLLPIINLVVLLALILIKGEDFLL